MKIMYVEKATNSKISGQLCRAGVSYAFDRVGNWYELIFFQSVRYVDGLRSPRIPYKDWALK